MHGLILIIVLTLTLVIDFIDENNFGNEHQPSQSYGLAGV